MEKSRSIRRDFRLPRALTILLVVAVATAVFVAPAAADQPVTTTFSLTLNGTYSGLCSFPVTVDTQWNATRTRFYDSTGVLVRSHYHVDEQDTFSANGHTLVGLPFTFNQVVLRDSAGNVTGIRAVGIAEKVPLPDGSLYISAGVIDWLAHPGADFDISADIGNPGDLTALCAALS